MHKNYNITAKKLKKSKMYLEMYKIFTVGVQCAPLYYHKHYCNYQALAY